MVNPYLVWLWTSLYFLSVFAADHVNSQQQRSDQGRVHRRKRNDLAEIEIRLDKSNATVDSLFLSVALPHIVNKLDYFSFQNNYTRNLCRQLTPVSVRVLCRPLIPPFEGHQIINGKPFVNQDMSVRVWEKLYSFMQSVGWHLSMDFTNMERRSNNDWNEDNAKAFLDYAEKNQIPIPDFQLGNEPNLYLPVFKITGQTPERTIKDFQRFKELLQSYPSYKANTISGPDVTRPTASSWYLERFMKHGGCDAVDEIAFHQYYMNLLSHKPTYHQFINTTVMDELKVQILKAREFQESSGCKKPLRITETSSVSGGLVNVADRFVAGFLWLDKLGVASLYGITRLYRFNLFGKSYALINSWPLKPFPDYYLSVLYKRLVDGPVLEVLGNPPYLRTYANCAKTDASKPGDVVIYLLNVRDSPTTVSLKQFTSQEVDTYIFTPGKDGDLLSKDVQVNGVMMTFAGMGQLTFTPNKAKGQEIQMPAHSFGFVLVPDAGAHLCHPIRAAHSKSTGSPVRPGCPAAALMGLVAAATVYFIRPGAVSAGIMFG